MRRVRPTITLTAAGVGFVALVLTTWAADPVWARAAGLDVWNVGRLEDELRRYRADENRLQAEFEVHQHRFAVNDLLAQEVIDGRRPLAAAADLYWQLNQETPGFATSVRFYYRGPTLSAKVAQNLLLRAERQGRFEPGRKAEVLARLRAEYAAAYGEPVP